MKNVIVVILAFLLIIGSGCKNKPIAELPEIQDSNYAWDASDDNFIEGLCKENDINWVKDCYRISCPKCYFGGAFVEQLPNGGTVGSFLYHWNGKVCCRECGYPTGHDWKIYKIVGEQATNTIITDANIAPITIGVSNAVEIKNLRFNSTAETCTYDELREALMNEANEVNNTVTIDEEGETFIGTDSNLVVRFR